MLTSEELRNTCLGSITAGAISRICCHPLDTVKARLQGPHSGAFKSTFQALRVTMAEEGIRGLYRGFGAVIVGAPPGVCLYLTAYEFSKDALSNLGSGRATAGGNFVTHFTAGMVAETVCCVIFVPVDVVKERLQVQRAGRQGSAPTPALPAYRGSMDAFVTIAKTEGLLGIYKGYGATLASFGPFSAFYFMFYEEAKARSRKLLQNRRISERADSLAGGSPTEREGQNLPFFVSMANAMVAAAASSWITNPLDIAKLRLQIQPVRATAVSRMTVPGGAPMDSSRALVYSGMWDAMRDIYRQGGFVGLFKGSGARIAFHAPSTAITMATYEKATSLWASVFDSSGH